MLYFEFSLTILLVGYLSVFPLLLYLYYKRKLKRLGALKQQYEFDITDYIMNAINNLIEIRVFNKRSFLKTTFSNYMKKRKISL